MRINSAISDLYSITFPTAIAVVASGLPYQEALTLPTLTALTKQGPLSAAATFALSAALRESGISSHPNLRHLSVTIATGMCLFGCTPKEILNHLFLISTTYAVGKTVSHLFHLVCPPKAQKSTSVASDLTGYKGLVFDFTHMASPLREAKGADNAERQKRAEIVDRILNEIDEPATKIALADLLTQDPESPILGEVNNKLCKLQPERAFTAFLHGFLDYPGIRALLASETPLLPETHICQKMRARIEPDTNPSGGPTAFAKIISFEEELERFDASYAKCFSEKVRRGTLASAYTACREGLESLGIELAAAIKRDETILSATTTLVRNAKNFPARAKWLPLLGAPSSEGSSSSQPGSSHSATSLDEGDGSERRSPFPAPEAVAAPAGKRPAAPYSGNPAVLYYYTLNGVAKDQKGTISDDKANSPSPAPEAVAAPAGERPAAPYNGNPSVLYYYTLNGVAEDQKGKASPFLPSDPKEAATYVQQFLAANREEQRDLAREVANRPLGDLLTLAGRLSQSEAGEFATGLANAATPETKRTLQKRTQEAKAGSASA